MFLTEFVSVYQQIDTDLYILHLIPCRKHDVRPTAICTNENAIRFVVVTV
jgi:hypothetical protein